ncbi:MAG TPA: septum formation protein Maf [Firmicutes bacterium]|nr:septum formation protein Maf [Bacillota bacterium]
MTLHFILGSASPRRKELFERMGLSFSVYPVNIDESVSFNRKRPADVVKELARKKMDALKNENEYDQDILVTADTLVFLKGQVLGKPSNRREAYEMLRSLSGKTHSVYTGVCICPGAGQVAFYERTQVDFMPLSGEVIERYLDFNEYKGKAGAYAIQGRGAFFISSISGDYYNVVGFPVNAFIRTLSREWGISLL